MVEGLPHLGDALGVQAVDGLVQDQQVRVPHQGQGDAQALLHPQGEVAHRLAPGAAQAHGVQQVGHGVPPAHPQGQALELQVFRRGEVGVDPRSLNQRAHPGEVGPGVAAGGPEEGEVPGGGGSQAAEEF